MTAGRRMKIEMTRAERKRRLQEPPTLEEKMEELDLPEGDRAEVRRFQAYLADSALPLIDRIEKHGADYLGFTPTEVESARALAADNRPAAAKE